MQGMRAAVARKRPALDQSRLDELVDEAGHVAFCDVKPFRQVLLHQALALREGGDKVELGDRQPDRLEFGADRLRDAAIEAHEAEPQPQRIGQGFLRALGAGHRGSLARLEESLHENDRGSESGMRSSV